jgi:multiple sugar transport system permease protein
VSALPTTAAAQMAGRPRNGHTRRAGIGHTIVGTAILAVLLLLFPLYWMVDTSLQPHQAGGVKTPWFPIHASLHGYTQAIHDQGGHLLTSLMVALGAVAFSLVVATPAAYALAQLKLRGVGIVLLMILISQMIPGIVVANALYRFYTDIGLLNSIPGLILADSALAIPFAILILRAYMLSLPRSIVEAARVDGAGPLRVFVSVVLPVSRNAVITAGLFSFLFAWGDFLFALTLTTGDNVRPLTVGLYLYVGTYVNDWSAAMATAVMASVPAVVLLVIAQRYIAAGTTAGAVK